MPHKDLQYFGLTISLMKTEVIYQNRSNGDPKTATIIVDNATLPIVDKFTYLGSVLNNTTHAKNDIYPQLAKARVALWKLYSTDTCGVSMMSQPTQNWQSVVLITLLYGCETWMLYHQHMCRLDQFHLHCLCKMLTSGGRTECQLLKCYIYLI